MPTFTLTAYNIELKNNMFSNNQVKSDSDTQQRAQNIASVIQTINPHVIGISEAANDPQEHNHFITNFLAGSGFQLAHGTSRGRQNLVFYFRDPFRLVEIDADIGFYDPWTADIDQMTAWTSATSGTESPWRQCLRSAGRSSD